MRKKFRSDVDQLRSDMRKRSGEIKNILAAIHVAKNKAKEAPTRLEYLGYSLDAEVNKEDLRNKVSMQIGDKVRLHRHFSAYRNTPAYKAKETYRQESKKRRYDAWVKAGKPRKQQAAVVAV